jgi:hypothetical protein
MQAMQPSTPIKRPLFSTFRTHVNLPFPLFSHPAWGSTCQAKLNSQTRACETCGRGRKTRDLEAQYHPWASGEDCILQPGAPALSTTIWSDRRQFDFTPRGHAVVTTQGLKMGTKAYREREDADYHEKANLEMSGAVVVENTMERRESSVDTERR